MRNAARIVLLLAASLGVGCSLIGLGIGAISDSKHKSQLLAGPQIETVKAGHQVELLLEDGRLVRGKFVGLEPVDEDDYARLWAEAQAALGPETPLPALGIGTVVTNRTGERVPGHFLGVDPGAVVLGRPDGVTRLALDEVGSIGDGQVQLSRGPLVRLVQEERLPARSRIVTLSKDPPERVTTSPHDVKAVTVRPHTHGKTVGFLVGLAVDVAIVASAVDSGSDNHSSCAPSDTYCGTSCPLVYSHAGQGWVLDSEVFGAAIFESAQRTDRAPLEHLVASDGRYRVRLRDEMDEIQWLDAVRLLVIDHPPGTRVVPAFDGTLHLLGAAARVPPRITDLQGRDVRRLLARDGQAWVSDGLAAAPALRDGLEFELPRPAGADALTFAFRARSTPWADVSKLRLMELLGDGVEAWRGRMETDAAARAEFLTALRREGLLTLRAWDGGGWREVGFLANLATVVARDVAVRVDLSGLPADVLRFRLDATPGLWTVDSVEAEFGAGVVEATAVAPLLARSRDGRDLRELLARTDGQRFELAPWTGDLELSFPASPLRPGLRRTVAIEAAGHYVTLSRGHGAPQRARFDELVREPGAFAHFSLELQAQAAPPRTAGATR